MDLSLMRCFIMAMSSLAIWRSRSFSTRFALVPFNAGSMAVMEESFFVIGAGRDLVIGHRVVQNVFPSSNAAVAVGKLNVALHALELGGAARHAVGISGW